MPSVRALPAGVPGRQSLRGLVGRVRLAAGGALRTQSVGEQSRPTGVVVAIITVATVLVTAILGGVGGAPHPVLHLYYVPIAHAATQLGWRGAVAAAVPAGLFGGPLGTALLGAAPSGGTAWIVRAVMFVTVGILIATLSGQAQRSLSSTMRDAVVSRRLRRALDRGAVEAHFQPIADLTSGRVVGFESLCRWRDTDGELVPPSVFIPLAERTGVILDLGRFMLRQTTAQCAAWSSQGLGHLVANVNVSTEQLSDRAFLGDVTAAHRLGIRIALDDFGTRHSSLVYLQDSPIDIIKIDQSFVARVDLDPKCSTLVLAIIEMSHALGATCIAEGIERDSRLTSLQVLGCDEGQGYHLGRPGPPPQPREGWLLLAEQGRLIPSDVPPIDVPGSAEPPASGPSTPQPRKRTR